MNLSWEFEDVEFEYICDMAKNKKEQQCLYLKMRNCCGEFQTLFLFTLWYNLKDTFIWLAINEILEYNYIDMTECDTTFILHHFLLKHTIGETNQIFHDYVVCLVFFLKIYFSILKFIKSNFIIINFYVYQLLWYILTINKYTKHK